jgi:hypothetical protein
MRLNSVAIQRRAGAAVVLALALFLSQPFHVSTSSHAAGGSPAAASVLGLLDQTASQAAAHDADLCSFCRASAQTRLGLRVALRVAALAATGPSLALHLPAPTPVRGAPLLRQAQPRAPPARLPQLAV